MIQQVANLGDDALSNLFDMEIGTVPFIPNAQSMLLRVQNISIPETGANTYEVHYKTQVFTKPAGKVNAPNEFSFEFRVDRNWAVYKAFVTWKNAIANTYSGEIGYDGANTPLRTPISVWAVSGDGLRPSGLGVWRFEGCFPTAVGEVGFDYTSGDPITVSVTMNYLRLNDVSL